MKTRPCMLSLAAGILGAALTSTAASGATVDLSVASIQVTQGFQNGLTALVAGRATMVRVTLAVSGADAPVPNVDAVLHMVVNGGEWTDGPYYSMNGPITVPLSPSLSTLDHTLNFIVVPPESVNVAFKVLVNPTKSVEESSYANNLYTSVPQPFFCRKVVEVAYVPINYPLGGGLPPSALLKPGAADNFLRGIYAVGEWDYHRSPLGSLTWESEINGTSGALINALRDIRNVQIPGAGYPRPEFIYGFLPGNPYSGNGLAEGIPGSVAFGNSDLNRWQRTFAHEIGHLWGRSHNNQQIDHPSIDVEHHLWNPLAIGQLHPSTKYDVMRAGLLTVDAWVASGTYNECLFDNRSECPVGDEDGVAGGAAADAAVACLRVAGVLTHAGRSVELAPFFRFDAAEPTVDDPLGDIAVEALDADGRVLSHIRVRTDTMRESCDGGLNPQAPIYVLIPEPTDGAVISRVVVRDLGAPPQGAGALLRPQPAGEIVASRERSAAAPTAAITALAPAPGADAPQGGAWTATPVEVRWTAEDADGDALSFMVLYSPDGGNRWAPVSVNATADGVVFDPANLPAAIAGQAFLRLRVSDGFNTTDVDMPVEAAMLGGTPPDIHILAPNATSYRQAASVLMHASAWDMEDLYMPDAALTWWSNVDGLIGTGRLFTTRSLSPGTHQITLSGIDSDGLESTDTISITITPRRVPTPDINEDGVVNGADLSILLGHWGVFGPGDLNFDGVVDGADLAILLGNWAT